MAVTVTRAPKRRASPPREPRVRKSGFKPILRMAFGRVRKLRAETLLGQICAISAFIVVMCGGVSAGVWMARSAKHITLQTMAINRYCDNPAPVRYGLCKDAGCLDRIIERDRTYVTICHPEALRS